MPRQHQLGNDPSLPGPTDEVLVDASCGETIDTVRVLYGSTTVDVIYGGLAPPEIFDHGFESGDTSAWSATVP